MDELQKGINAALHPGNSTPGFSHSGSVIPEDAFRGIVFDLDGVLFDTEPLHREAWNNALEEMGIPISQEELMSWTGVPCQQLSLELENRWEGRYTRDEYYRLKEKHFFSIINSRNSLFDGLADMLEKLSSRYPLAVATSNVRINTESLLRNSGIDGFFKALVCYDDVEKHKPHPEAYLKAASLIAVDPGNCIALDDSPAGCSSALCAGMHTLGIASSFPPTELKMADVIYPDTREACRRILEQSGISLH